MKILRTATIACVTIGGLIASASGQSMGLKPYDEEFVRRHYGLEKPNDRGLSACEYLENCHRCILAEVIDGDTLVASCDERRVIRIAGIDAPERGARAACDKERSWAEAATDFLRTLLPNAAGLEVLDLGADRYGRTVAMVRYKGRDLGAELVWLGHAKPWIPYAKKPSWCG